MSDGDLGEVRAELRALMREVQAGREEERIRWEALDRRLDEYSKRIRILERWRDGIAGAAVFLGILWAVFKTIVWPASGGSR